MYGPFPPILGPLLLTLAAAGCSRAGQPYPPAPPRLVQPSTENVPELIRQLAHEDWHVRERAQARLANVGGRPADALRRAMQEPGVDPEVASRIDTALHRAEALAPTLVSIDVRAAHPCVVYRELALQANASLDCRVGGPGTVPVTMRLDRVPFWEAVQRVARASRTEPYEWVAPATISIRNAPFPFADHSCLSGPFFFTAGPPGQLADGSLLVDVWAYADPKVKVVRGPLRAAVTDVLAADGSALLAVPATRPFDDGAFVFRRPSGGAWAWLLKVALPPVKGAVRTLPLVRGKVPFEVRTASERWVIDDPVDAAADGAGKPAGPWHLVYRRAVEPAPGRWRFEFDLMTARGSTHHTLAVMRYLDALEIRAFTATGERFTGGPFRNVESAPDGSRVKLTFALDAPAGGGRNARQPPARLVVDLPADVLTLDVPFEFANLPVPPPPPDRGI